MLLASLLAAAWVIAQPSLLAGGGPLAVTAVQMAAAGLTAPARAKASAPPAATTARFFIIRRSHPVVLPFDRTLRSCLKRR